MNIALLECLLRDWGSTARPEQLRPRDCRKWWYVQAGRAWGKTLCASNHTLDIMEQWGTRFLGGACSKTMDEVQATMVEGPSGLLTQAERRGYKLDWKPSRAGGRMVHPSGAKLYVYSGHLGEIRGPNTNYWWLDEVAWWAKPTESWDNINKTMRVPAPSPGIHGVITSSPKARSEINRLLQRDEGEEITCTFGALDDNYMLPRSYVEAERRRGQDAAGNWTQKGRQEFLGQFIDGVQAGWTREMIDDYRIPTLPTWDLRRIVIGVDPAVSDKPTSDDSGIVVVAEAEHQNRRQFYVLADDTQHAATPAHVMRRVVALEDRFRAKYGCPTKVLIEDNQGKQLWDSAIQSAANELELPTPQYALVTATRSKSARAELAADVYLQGRVHHVGEFPELEAQMVGWFPGMDSPDRMDALVHALLDFQGDNTPSLSAGA